MLAYSGAFGSVRGALQRLHGAAAHDRGRVAREAVARSTVRAVPAPPVPAVPGRPSVHLVQEHHDARHFHLPRQQHVLARLRHRPIRRCHHQDGAIHLRRTRDHVLDVVTVPGHVHVRIVALVRLVFHVRNVDRDAARLFFRRIVDLIVRPEFRLPQQLPVLS